MKEHNTPLVLPKGIKANPVKSLNPGASLQEIPRMEE